MADKPNVTATLSSLIAEAKDPEPYTIALSNSKLVTFPDPLAMEADEAEKYLDDLMNMSPSEALRKWLPEDQAEAVLAEKLNFRQLRHVVSGVVKYYNGNLGDAGEGRGSRR